MLTLDRLQKRGWQLLKCCFLCGYEEESINHILIHCIVAKVLWDSLCFVWCSVGLSRNYKGGLIELEGPFCRGKKEKDMEVYPVVHFLDSLEGKK